MAKKKRNWGDLSDKEKEAAKKKYKKQTGPEVSDEFGFRYTSGRNVLHLSHKKGEHGGKRKGSGNKKGSIKFCGTCRKQTSPENKCTCKK